MLNSRQQEIMGLLSKRLSLQTSDLQEALKLSRARVHQLITPLIKKGLVKKEGKARATIYRITDKRNIEKISRENWDLRRKVMELEKALDDRKLIERAKEILIAQFGILPTEAYRKLQTRSMESGRSMREIAEGILDAYE